MNIKYYWINIDKSIHRKIYMEEQFKYFNINNQRITAITPENLIDVQEDKPPYFCGNNGSCGHNNHNDCKFEYSCSCSHLNAIKEGYKSGDNYFIVCEDDIYFPFKIDFEKIIKNLPDNWEIFQLMILDEGANDKLYNDYYKKNINFIDFNPMKCLYSTGMYLINRNGAKKILDLFINKETNKYNFKNAIIKQADFLLYMNVKTYTTTFPFCHPNPIFISEIHPNHYYNHLKAINKIMSIINDNKLSNIFINDYYSFDDFSKIYVLFLEKNK